MTLMNWATEGMTWIDKIKADLRLPTVDAGHFKGIVCAIFERMNDIEKCVPMVSLSVAPELIAADNRPTHQGFMNPMGSSPIGMTTMSTTDDTNCIPRVTRMSPAFPHKARYF